MYIKTQALHTFVKHVLPDMYLKHIRVFVFVALTHWRLGMTLAERVANATRKSFIGRCVNVKDEAGRDVGTGTAVSVTGNEIDIMFSVSSAGVSHNA